MNKILTLINYVLAGDSYNGPGRNDGFVGTMMDCFFGMSVEPLRVYVQLVREKRDELYRDD